jgi:hypothetical protein
VNPSPVAPRPRADFAVPLSIGALGALVHLPWITRDTRIYLGRRPRIRLGEIWPGEKVYI